MSLIVPAVAFIIVLLLVVLVVYAAVITHHLGRMRRFLRVRTERLQKDLMVTTVLEGHRYCDPRHVCRFEAQVYSQHGEDGIISEILNRIDETNRVFVEIGSGEGVENNTRYRLIQGWSGIWFDADAEKVRRSKCVASERCLEVVHARVTAENAAQLMRRHAVPAVFDLLSLDIDRNTSHIWRALAHLAPRIFGASLTTLQALGESLGYALVGCELSGTNAFFVRRELLNEEFLGPRVSHPAKLVELVVERAGIAIPHAVAG